MKQRFFVLGLSLAVFAAIAATPAQAQTPRRTYSTTADFNQGVYAGTNSTDVADQLQLSEGGSAFDFAWVANSGDSLLIKVDTRTGKAVAGYLTGPPRTEGALTDSDFSCGFGGNVSPSRTAVDADGNCWVANRTFGGQGTISLILAEGGVDRDGSGVIETSRDVDGDGIINPDVPGEVLPWGTDERVVRHYQVGNVNGLPRALAIGANGNIFVGLFNERRVLEFAPSVNAPPPAGAAPAPLRSWDVPNSPYGFAFAPDGRLYMATLSSPIVELDLESGETRVFPTGNTCYGIGADANGIVWGALLSSPASVARLDPAGDGTLTNHAATAGTDNGRSVAVDQDGNIWLGCSNFGAGSAGSASKFAPDGTFLGNFSSDGQVALGVGIAANGNVLVVNQDSLTVAELDRNTGDLIQLMTTGTGPSPCLYTYSDFTGSGRGATTERTGRWIVVHDSGEAGTEWGRLSWNANVPQGTSIVVEARTADSRNALGNQAFFPVENDVPFDATGRFIEVRVTLRSTRVQERITPVLFDITVAPATTGEARIALLPRVIDFGELRPGRRAQRRVLIANTGDAPATVRLLGVPRGVPFASPRGTFTLQPGQRRSFPVEFRAARAGTFQAPLVFAVQTGDPTTPVRRLAVRLNGEVCRPNPLR
jgi:streptogramin lyase